MTDIQVVTRPARAPSSDEVPGPESASAGGSLKGCAVKRADCGLHWSPAPAASSEGARWTYAPSTCLREGRCVDAVREALLKTVRQAALTPFLTEEEARPATRRPRFQGFTRRLFLGVETMADKSPRGWLP
jgi:hypothetical protein